MKKHLLIIYVLFYWACGTSKENKTDSEEVRLERPYKLIGYVAGWKDFSMDSTQARQLTHINYAFANVEEGGVQEGRGRLERDTENLKALNELKQYNPQLLILISIGGWTWSGGFSDAALTDQSREIFANSAVGYMLRHHLDGVDIDWEYPGLPGNDNVYRPEDKDNFVAMLKRVREKLDSMSTQNEREYLLTIASAGFDEYVEVNDLGAAQEYLDFINIMTYDFTGEWSDTTGHHANLYAGVGHDRSVARAVEKHRGAGIPPEKLVVGIPFYGRGWVNVEPAQNGLGQPGQGKGSLSYRAIKNLLEVDGYNVYWDSAAAAPYIWNEKQELLITFENPVSIAVKAEFIRENGLGGAMFWEFSEDDGELLEQLFLHLK